MASLQRINGYLRHETTTGIQLREMDAFRGWACLGVVLYHSNVISGWGAVPGGPDGVFYWLLWPFNFGWFGLDVFFFLSGFLLYLKFGKAHLENRPRPPLAGFFKRRLLRLAPAYYVSMAVIVAVGTIMYRDSFDFAGKYDVIAHALFLNNVFSEYVGTINGVYWTLALEFQFYLVLPFMAAWFHGRRWPLGLIAVLAAVGCFKAGALYYLAGRPVSLNPMYPPVNLLAWRLDQFALGIASGSIWLMTRAGHIPDYLKRSRALAYAVLFGGMALFYAMVAYPYYHGGIWTVPGLWSSIYRAPLISVSIGMVIMATLNLDLAKKVLANPLIEFVGIISYSLYIWHYPIIYQLKRLMPSFDMANAGEYAYLHKAGFVLISLALTMTVSVISYMMLERPFLKRGFSFRQLLVAASFPFRRAYNRQ